MNLKALNITLGVAAVLLAFTHQFVAIQTLILLGLAGYGFVLMVKGGK